MSPTANRGRRPASSQALHLAEIRRRYDEALAATGFDAVVIGNGSEIPVYGDDQHYPFRASPWLLQWAPLTRHPGACLVYRPGRQPRLLLLEPDDYWHQPAAVPLGDWQQGIELVRVGSLPALRRQLPRSRCAVIAPPGQLEVLHRGGAGANPPALLTRLAFTRALKTSHEVDCIRAATRLGLAGHDAAATAFHAGASEYGISQAFLAAAGQSDDELPYPSIVAMNRNGATLHYQHRAQERPARRDRHSLLIDAGCSHAGYACDITRTHAARRGLFAQLVTAMDQAQLRLCAAVRPGVAFGELQLLAHRELGGLLADAGLVRLPADAIVDERISDLFFPHGLGHLLGLQVHDIGGNLLDPEGHEGKPPRRFPRMRLNRTLAPGQVLTIEPGLYFIDSLLARLRQHRRRRSVDWEALEALTPCGGIRIEDNVLVTAAGHENLTRSSG
jgi:Xaa-Pro dipeptidase